MSNTQIIDLIDSNFRTLDAAAQILSSLVADQYTQIQQPYFESSVGKHLRHILDHYSCFCRDLEGGVIDYDQRHRDSQLENDRDYALSYIRKTQQFLNSLKASHSVDQPLSVVLCHDVDIPDGELTQSSLGRELQFLQGHSVHHYALMAAMLRIAGVSIEQDFGVAPSTIVHKKTMKVSA